MTRAYLLLGVFVAMLGATSLFFTADNPASPESVEERRLEDMQLRRREFAEKMRVCEMELETGSRSLRDVAESVHEYAKAYYPEYLRSIACVEPGDDAREQIAHNCLRWFQVLPSATPAEAARLGAIRQRLQLELENWQ